MEIEGGKGEEEFEPLAMEASIRGRTWNRDARMDTVYSIKRPSKQREDM